MQQAPASPACAGSTQTLSESPSAMDVDSKNSNMSDTAAMEALGSHSRELIQAIQALESLRIDATIPSLPKFVVVGDQSAGKSSIIEGICDISVPRSEGTCTKCPYHITTTASKEGEGWSCLITLVRKFVYKSKAKAGRDESKYDKWVQQDADEYNFKLVSQKEHLEDFLSRAQLAVLDPERDPAEYLNGELPSMEKPPLGFSPNTIKLRITGPNLPELSFFDLPGAINVHEDDSEQHLVDFVQRLMKNHLRDEKALILLAVSCDHDTENSTAFRYVKECGAIDRCMGVLTKPDLLGVNRDVPIQRILKGEKFRLGGGWFVTKSLSQKELNSEDKISHTEARDRERLFFTETEPWCSSMLSFAPRLGIPNLRTTISSKLTQHIIEGLPEIADRIQRRQVQVNHGLELLPEPSEAPSFTVMHEIDKVCTVISELLGNYASNSEANQEFRKKYRKLLEQLQQQLKDARPRLKLHTPGHKSPSIDISSEEEEGEEEEKAMSFSPQTPSKFRKGANGQRVPAASTPRSGTPRTKIEDGKMASPDPERLVFTLNEVRGMYEQGSGSGIPNQTNPAVTDRVVIRSLARWGVLVSKTLQEIDQFSRQTILASVDKSLEARSETKLCYEMKRTIGTLLQKLMNQQMEVLHNVVICETHKPKTLAGARLEQLHESVKAKLVEQRLEIRVHEYFDRQDAKQLKTTKAEDRKKRANEAKGVLSADPYAREIKRMALIFAYYDIAAERLADSVAIHLEHGLIHLLESGLVGLLRQELQVTNSAHCAMLLAEDPEQERARRDLLDEKLKLEQAYERLRGLSVQY